VDGNTVPEAYLRRIDTSPAQSVLKHKENGQYVKLTWEDFHSRVLKVFTYLQELGLKSDDKVCIFSQSNPEWMMIDNACLASGFVVVPMYHSNSVEDVTFILEDSEVKVVFVDDESCCQKMAAVFAQT